MNEQHSISVLLSCECPSSARTRFSNGSKIGAEARASACPLPHSSTVGTARKQTGSRGESINIHVASPPSAIRRHWRRSSIRIRVRSAPLVESQCTTTNGHCNRAKPQAQAWRVHVHSIHDTASCRCEYLAWELSSTHSRPAPSRRERVLVRVPG